MASFYLNSIQSSPLKDDVHSLRHATPKLKFQNPVYMSPVSQVFHTEATVSIGLKNVLRV